MAFPWEEEVVDIRGKGKPEEAVLHKVVAPLGAGGNKGRVGKLRMVAVVVVDTYLAEGSHKEAAAASHSFNSFSNNNNIIIYYIV